MSEALGVEGFRLDPLKEGKLACDFDIEFLRIELVSRAGYLVLIHALEARLLR